MANIAFDEDNFMDDYLFEIPGQISEEIYITTFLQHKLRRPHDESSLSRMRKTT